MPTPPASLVTDLGMKNCDERLIIRMDQPVENVEFRAHTLLRSGDGGILTPSSRKVQYRWFRSKRKLTCANADCANIRNIGSIESILNGERYCSNLCFLESWKKLSSKYILPAMIRESEDIPFGVKPCDSELEWETIGNDKVIFPTKNDVGHSLKVECSAVAPDGRVSVVAESTETSAVIGISEGNHRLLHRKTKYAPNVSKKPSVAAFIASEGGGAVLRVVSYNLLAEIYATRQLYPYCPMWAIGWGYRRQLIINELIHQNADIICLQEMQQDSFEDYMYPQLKSRGYEGLFKAKTREAHGRKGRIDGCAIFYKTQRFHLLNSMEIELNALANYAANSGNFQSSEFSARENQVHTEKVLKRLCRDNVAEACVFETIPEDANEEPQQLCVVCTHVFWDPEYSDVKFWQTQALLHEINHITGNGEIPLIICGDFNSTPESSVVQYLARDSVDPNHDDFHNDPLNILSSCYMMNHGLGLGSAYEAVTGSEPRFTNYTAHYSGVLDYIWFTQRNINALSVLDIPEEPALRGEDDTFMPNSCFPSDHISLCVDIQVLKKNHARSRPATPGPPSPVMSPAKFAHRNYDHGNPMGRTAYSSPNPAMLNQYHIHQQHQRLAEDLTNSPTMSPSGSPALHPVAHAHAQYSQYHQPYYYQYQ